MLKIFFLSKFENKNGFSTKLFKRISEPQIILNNVQDSISFPEKSLEKNKSTSQLKDKQLRQNLSELDAQIAYLKMENERIVNTSKIHKFLETSSINSQQQPSFQVYYLNLYINRKKINILIY